MVFHQVLHTILGMESEKEEGRQKVFYSMGNENGCMNLKEWRDRVRQAICLSSTEAGIS